MKPASLARAGCGKLLEHARGLRHTYVFRGGIGSFASVASAYHAGKLVRIVRVKQELDAKALLTTLENNPWFTKPDAQGDHCWNAVRVVHRLRLMRGQDAAVERLGSSLHQLFQANPTKPHRHVARLFLREAGLGGEPSSAQDDIIREMSRFILEELDKQPFCQRGSKRQRRQRTQEQVDIVEVREGLRRGAVLGPVPQEQRPTKLRPEVEKHLRAQAAVARGLGGKLPNLPFLAEDHRRMETVRRDVGGRLCREAMQRWFESDEGKEWRQSRGPPSVTRFLNRG